MTAHGIFNSIDFEQIKRISNNVITPLNITKSYRAFKLVYDKAPNNDSDYANNYFTCNAFILYTSNKYK